MSLSIKNNLINFMDQVNKSKTYFFNLFLLILFKNMPYLNATYVSPPDSPEIYSRGSCLLCRNEEKYLVKRTAKSRNKHTLKCFECDNYICKIQSVVSCQNCANSKYIRK